MSPSPLPANTPRRWPTMAVCCLLALIVWAVFGQTRHFDFVNFDDPDYVFDNPLTNQGLTLHNVVWAFTHENRHEWLPVTYVSRMADSQIYGRNAGGHHLTNVLLHATTAILLFLALRRLTATFWCAAAAAAMFAIHPLRVQSVAWVVERKDVLSGVFFMLTLLAWTSYLKLRAEPPPGVIAPPRRARTRYGLALLFFVLGALSKPTVVTLPLILLLLDYWPLKRLPNRADAHRRAAWFHLLWEKSPFFLISAGAAVATMLTQRNVVLTAQHKDLSWRIGNVLFAYADYLWHTVWPAGLALVYPYSNTNLSAGTVAASALVLLAISAVAVAAWRRHPYLLVGWLWFLVMLLPVIDSMQATQNCRADRYTYLPQIGLFILITWGAVALTSHWRFQKWILGSAAAAVLAALTADAHIQTRYWQNSVTIWSRAIEVTPPNYFAENSLGSALSNLGKSSEAIPHFERALQFKPDCIDARVNYGITLENLNQPAQAIQQFEQALQFNPNSFDACYNLGSALIDQGKATDAIPYLSRAVTLKPDHAKAQYALGLALASDGKWDDAIPHYEQAVGAKIDLLTARYITGIALAAHGKWDPAIALYQQALESKPDFAEAHYRLGIALAHQNRTAEAAPHLQQAIDLATRQNNAALAESARAQLATNSPAARP